MEDASATWRELSSLQALSRAPHADRIFTNAQLANLQRRSSDGDASWALRRLLAVHVEAERQAAERQAAERQAAERQAAERQASPYSMKRPPPHTLNNDARATFMTALEPPMMPAGLPGARESTLPGALEATLPMGATPSPTAAAALPVGAMAPSNWSLQPSAVRASQHVAEELLELYRRDGMLEEAWRLASHGEASPLRASQQRAIDRAVDQLQSTFRRRRLATPAPTANAATGRAVQP